MPNRLLISATLASLLLSSALVAEDNLDADLGGFDTEEVVSEELSELDGFGDDEITPTDDTPTQTVEVKESIFSLTGDLAFKTSAGYISHNVDNINYSGVNQAQTSLYLQLDAKLSDSWKLRVSGDAYYDAIYDIHSHNNYNDDILDEYKTQLRFDDVYIQGRLTSDMDLKVGRQIVVWGKSDSIRITDVINPTDNRQPGMTDIEDLRLSVGMLKLDYYVGEWNLSGMIIGESRTFIEAPARSEFFPVDNIFPIAPNPFIELDQPNTSMDNIQYAFAANGVFSGWDLSFYAADVLDQKWFINPDTHKREVSKIKMLGSALNVAIGSWLLKSEIAVLDGVKYNSTTDDKVRADILVGFDYMGIKDTVLSLEIANRHIFDHEDSMSSYTTLRPDFVNENEVQTAMRVTHSFLNDTLNTTALVSLFGPTWQYGGFARIWAEYDVMDGVSANFGVVDYIYGEKPFAQAISDNDRVFADITYSF
jgi:hypothetical protein